MAQDLAQFECEIQRQRTKLDAWLLEAYADIPEQRYYGEMDASFPGWHEIEQIAGQIFDERITSRLRAVAIDSLLFFISRSDEIGSIIAWLSTDTGSPLSLSGDLTYDDFVFLCDQSLSRDDDFCDYQLVACFQKLASLNQRDIGLLRRFFETKADSYTRRLVVHAFSKFRLGDTIPLVEKLWATDDCEFAKISCLYSLEPFPEARQLFARLLTEYQHRFPVAEADYRQKHMERFREIQAD